MKHQENGPESENGERERKRESVAEKGGSRQEMEAELLGLILIQTGKITGG